MNLTLELTTAQVVDLIQEMPPKKKLTTLKSLQWMKKNARISSMMLFMRIVNATQ